jgi:hypothetical protein
MNRGQLIKRIIANGEEIVPEYQAMLDYTVSQGGTLPSEAVQKIHNRLMRAVRGSILGKHDLFRFFAADIDGLYTRLNWGRFFDPAESADYGLNVATKNGSVPHVANKGYKGTGISGEFMNQNWNITNHLRRASYQDVTIWGVMFDVTPANWNLSGTTSNSALPFSFTAAVSNEAFVSRVFTASLVVPAPSFNTSDGVFHKVISTANSAYFENGVQKGIVTTSAINTTNEGLNLGFFKNAASYFTNGIFAMGICRNLTPEENTKLRNAIQKAINAMLQL